ncbi:MAG TPA: hypothetical protein DDW52_14660 [Planctomycetaceae bacterium]|nr:hypothetical protein [Planctomycetaceae bacterium]
MLEYRPNNTFRLAVWLGFFPSLLLGTTIATGQNVGVVSYLEPVSVAQQTEPNSPSDQIVPQEPIQLNLSDGATTTPPPASPALNSQVPAPNQAGLAPRSNTPPTNPNASRPRPRMSTLGRDGQFRTLGAVPTYASPLTSFAGLSTGSRDGSRSSYFRSAGHRKLSRTPEMFGDLRRPGSAITFNNIPTSFPSEEFESIRPEDFPTAASFGGMRVSENNVAMPQDRLWVTYNHQHNAFARPGGDLHLDRFTFGVEKTFFDGSSSIEVRLPVAASIEPNGQLTSSTIYGGGSFGNLSMILKHVLWGTDSCAIAAGLAVEAPSGSQSFALDATLGQVFVTHDPNAVYLTPFLGMQREINDVWFANGFLQVEVPTGGDRLITQVGAGQADTFYLNQPTWLQIDLGVGAWLFAPSDQDPTGLALINELHISSALSQPDRFDALPGGGTPNIFVNSGETIDTLVNYTTGLHAALQNQWSLRTGISVPLLTQRIFDTEIMVQVNRSF